MYRRAELKELIAMHADAGELGGDLKTDTVTIIGATLDLQEKIVKQAMTAGDRFCKFMQEATSCGLPHSLASSFIWQVRCQNLQHAIR